MGEQSRGAKAVRAAADRYGFEVQSARWFDGIGPSGTKYEVKSTTGRGFRLWRDQHRSLSAAPSAFYVFVSMSKSGSILDMVRRDTTTVTGYINESGGWVRSGHSRDVETRERYVNQSLPFD